MSLVSYMCTTIQKDRAYESARESAHQLHGHARTWSRALTNVVSTHLFITREQEDILLPSLQDTLLPNLDKEVSSQLEDGSITLEFADGAD